MARHKEFDTDAAVDAAMQLFWTQGYARTTPAQLVEHLGIGRGSLYNAFHSKHGLYEQALRRYQEQEAQALITHLDGPGSARERLRTALDVLVRLSLDDEHRRGCLMTNAAVELADHDDTVAHLVRRTLDRQEAALTSTVREGQRAGEIDPELDAREVAALFLATTNGLRVLAKADPDPRRLHAVADAFMRTL